MEQKTDSPRPMAAAPAAAFSQLIPNEAPLGPRVALGMGMKHRLAQKVFHALLKEITVGSLRVNYLEDGTSFSFGAVGSGLSATMNVADKSLIFDILTIGEFALGMGYVEGRWDSPSKYHVLLVLMLNEERFRRVTEVLSWLNPQGRLIKRTIERRTVNTIENCRKEIGVTYGIGNDFYEMMLGPSMTYTCAIWPRPEATLEEAQLHKMNLIVGKANIRPGSNVLEIGCGWGSLANHIQTTTGATVKGIALCHEQVDYCKQKYPQIDFAYQDYRDVRGEYDSVVSVGVLEHVGRPYIDEFMVSSSALLKPGGRMVAHGMIYHGPDMFMGERGQKHTNFSSVLMPNADSPTPSQVVKAALKTGDLRLLHYETFGIHYTRTAQEWQKNLERNREQILKCYPEKLFRAHEYSWAMGAAAMETGTSLVHMVFEKSPYGAPLSNIHVR